MSLFSRHLHQVGETYVEHLRHAMSFAVALTGAAIACGIHALLPFLFEKTGSACIQKLHDRMVVNRSHLSATLELERTTE